jgi:hypothetical protein
MFLKKLKMKQIIDKIEVSESGFRIVFNGEVTEFEWSEIKKLTGFKVDRFTFDDISLKNGI